MFLGSSDTTSVYNTIFAGNSAVSGGAIFSGSNMNMTNSVFSGNVADQGGVMVMPQDGSAAMMHCTIHTVSPVTGHGIFMQDNASLDVDNAILWGFSSPFSGNATFTLAVDYSDVQGGSMGTGNIDADPLFVGNPLDTGAWTAVTYDADEGATLLKTQGTTWADNALAGLFVKPSATDARIFSIHGNSADSITVMGDLEGAVLPGDSFSLFDFHLAASSPCIDTGTATGAPIQDIEGRSRYDLPGVGVSVYDMGAFEYVP